MKIRIVFMEFYGRRKSDPAGTKEEHFVLG
jgi:hypothetical protein